jgi:hypothetical protein
MRDLPKQTRSLIDRGQLEELLRIPILKIRSQGVAHWAVGALVLTGDLQRALALASSLKTSEANRDAVEFFLILGLTRAGDLKGPEGAEARLRQLTRPERRLSRNSTKISSLSRFFVAQALGFMAYFSGESTRPAEFAQQALSFAEAEDWDFARLLATDLLGHSCLRAGEVRRGLDLLRRALKLAQSHQNEGLALAIRISILKYEVAHGLPDLTPRNSLGRLEAALKTWVPNDSYSQSELRLELAKQLALRGQVRRARQVLELAADSILGSRNRSQAALLHARLAWLARLEGRWSDARLAISSSKQFCFAEGRDEVLDRPLLSKLELMMDEINVDDPSPKKSSEGRSSRRRTFSNASTSASTSPSSSLSASQRHARRNFHEIQVENRIQARRSRETLASKATVKKGEDRLGDVLDLGFLPSLREGLYGSLRDAWEREGRPRLLPEAIHLLLGLPNQMAVIFDRPDTRVTQLARRPTLLKALQVLQGGEIHVEDFTRRVWDYRYEPQVHDRLIAVTLTRIRKELGIDAIERRGPVVRWKSHLQLQVHFWTSQNFSEELAPTLQRSAGVPMLENSMRDTSSTPGSFAQLAELDLSTGISQEPASRLTTREPTDLPIDTNLNLRQLLLLKELASLGSISMDEHRLRNGISRATALRDLNQMRERGWLRRVGATRATRYTLGQNVQVSSPSPKFIAQVDAKIENRN